MCGIIGFVSSENTKAAVLIEGLKKLEYRGYDSCGIALVHNQEMALYKTKGKVKVLEDKLDKSLEGTSGLAHTRWATHGEPNDVNAHPHQIERVTLVHNGIIENSHELRKFYEMQGVTFKTETDTEVACAVLNDCMNKTNNKIEAIQKACTILKGSYAFGIFFDDELDKIYAIRKDSPLLLGEGKNIVFLASDCSAFLETTNRVLELNENEIAILDVTGITIIDEEGNEVKRESKEATLSLEEIQKDGYDTFLMKEIHEEPMVIKKTFHHYMKKSLNDLNETMPSLKKYKRFVFVGCGSAYHAGMIAKTLMEQKARVISSTELASEFRYSNPILDDDTAVVFISQSGETADTLAALRMCNEKGIDTFAIVNVLGSSLAKEAKVFLPTLAGKEISVATTKAYCSQVAVLSLLCLKKAMEENKLSSEEKLAIENEIERLPLLMKKYIDQTSVEKIADTIQHHNHVFFLGRGLDYALSLEGSLKLKEISYIHSEAYAAGELKHGTISLIEKDTPVITCITNPDLVLKSISNTKEVETRGAKVFLLIREDLYSNLMDASAVILLPKVHDVLQGIVSILPYQLLAYTVAKKLGCDIDQPKNLAKSVTVE